MSNFEALTSVNPVSAPPYRCEIRGIESAVNMFPEEERKRFAGLVEVIKVCDKAGFSIESVQRIKSMQEYKNFLDGIWDLQRRNHDALLNLLAYKTEDLTEQHAINVKIAQFVRALGDQRHIFPALRINFKKIHQIQPEEEVAWE